MPLNLALLGSQRDALFLAASQGLEKTGHAVRGQIVGCFSPSQPLRGVDAVVVCRRHGRSADAIVFYQSRFPLLVLDSAVLSSKRGGEMFQCGGLGEPNKGKLEDLGLESVAASSGSAVLLLGQKAGDPAHGMPRVKFQAWAEETLAQIRALDNDSEVVWRPDPADVWALSGVDGTSNPGAESLAAVFARARVLVTYNSPLGLDALRAGLAVVTSAATFYGSLASAVSDWARLGPPNEEALQDLLARIAKTQFSLAEISTGAPFAEFLDSVENPQPEVVIEPEQEDEPVGDDLTKIPDIGKKTAEILRAAGIVTFQNVIDADLTREELSGLMNPSKAAIRRYQGAQ